MDIKKWQIVMISVKLNYGRKNERQGRTEKKGSTYNISSSDERGKSWNATNCWWWDNFLEWEQVRSGIDSETLLSKSEDG